MLVKPNIAKKVAVLDDTNSECVLWLRFEINDSFSFILGALYIACETSRFYCDDTFVKN